MKPYTLRDLTKEELIEYIQEHFGFVPQRDFALIMAKRMKTKATTLGNKSKALFADSRKNGHDSKLYTQAMTLQDQSWELAEDADVLWQEAIKMGRDA